MAGFGDVLFGLVLRVFVGLYKEFGFRNSDVEYPDRESCTQLSMRVLDIGSGVVLSVPIYECNGGTVRLILQDERTCVKFCVVGSSEEHTMDVLVRDIGLEHYSSFLGCMVCTATGYSVKLGLITIYSRVPIPVKPWLCVVGGSDDESMCSICWERFSAGSVRVVTACNHPYHEGCLVRWGRVNSTCPNCRTDL